tara:strand:+ start:11878 stop:12711 length:834 start_codon:yes stop_codon:yes gene_type:complete
MPMNLSKYSLKGKTSLITGASGFLGEQHARALLEVNSNLVLTDIDKKHLLTLEQKLKKDFPKNKIFSFEMDVTNQSEVENVLEEINNLGLFIGILVNNAAIDPKVEEGKKKENLRLENFQIDQWDLEMNVGLRGAFICTKIFGKQMTKEGKGVILNIASDLSVIAPDQSLYFEKGIQEENQYVKPVTYSVIKTGIIGLTRYVAAYWAHKGIRCNALSPGGVFNHQKEEFVKKLENKIPLGRMAKHDEYNSTIQYLCSDASSYLNGQNIIVDGGRSIL